MEALLDREPQNNRVRRNLVMLLRETGEYERAIEHVIELRAMLELRASRTEAKSAESNPSTDETNVSPDETDLLESERKQLTAELVELQFLAGRSTEAVGTFEQIPGPMDTGNELLFWAGLSYREAGDPGRASELLERSLQLQPYQPMARYFLAEIHLQRGRYADAEALFNSALKQEPNLTMAYYPLALAELAQEKTESAHSLLTRAESALPWNPEVRNKLQELEQKAPELAAARERDVEERRHQVAPPAVSIFPSEPSSIPLVRVGLAENVSSLHVKTGGDWVLASPDSGTLSTQDDFRTGTEAAQRIGGAPETDPAAVAGTVARGKAGAILRFTSAPGELVVHREHPDEPGTYRELGTSGTGLVLSYQDPAAATALYDIDFGEGYFFAARGDRFYRGVIETVPHDSGFTLINRVNVEEYLYSVVPSEMPAYWPQQALQAQAVAARSYTFANMGKFADRGFDLYGSVKSHAYLGIGREAAPTTEAVNATRGLVLTADGRPVNAFYSANSGGYTESSESVWNFKSDLRAVADPQIQARGRPLPPAELASWLEERPPSFSSHPRYSARAAYRWSHWVTPEEIRSRVKGADSIGEIRALVTRGRGISGRVEALEIRGTQGSVTVRSDYVRRLGGLRSNLFMVQPGYGPDGGTEYFVFYGGGWGHGVGMDQSGAAGMADAGYDFRSILDHFYPGYDLTVLY